GGAHAAARGAAGDDQRIDLPAHQPRGQVGAEEAGGVLLGEQAVTGAEIEPLVDLDAFGPGLERDYALLLERPDADVAEIRIVIHDGRKDDRDRTVVGDREQRLYRRDLLVEIGAQHHLGVRERLEHVDDEERRPFAETDPQPEPTLPEKFLILLPAR